MNSSPVEIPVKSVFTLLDEVVQKHPASSAMDFLGRKWTYSELGDLVDRAACGFRQLGVRKGVNVGLCLPNMPYYVICYFAIMKAGGTVVNYNPLYVERELQHQIDDSQTKIMVTLDLKQIYPKVAAMLETSHLERVVVCHMSDLMTKVKGLVYSVLQRSEIADIPEDLRHVSFNKLTSFGSKFRVESIDPRKDVAVLQYTGGTTGVPKGAMLTHANITANVEQVRQWVTVGTSRTVGNDKVLCVLPLFHVFAMTVTMNLGIVLGAELILVPRFEVAQVMKTITKKRPTIVAGVPTIFGAILAAAKNQPFDMSFVRFCISGGAPLPVEMLRAFEKITGVHMVEGYGLTESSPVATCGPLNGTVKPGSAGLPMPGTIIEIRSSDGAGKTLNPGETGEVVVFGPQVMAGYWQRPSETSQVMIDGGLKTGDVGYVDADGYLFLVDRIKDLIICGGYNVYPRIVEEALYRHPDVIGAAVIGIPDSYRGQSPKAFVQLREGATTTPADIKEFLAGYISRVEMPKDIEIREELPKTSVGKLSKKMLIDEEKSRSAQSTATTAT